MDKAQRKVHKALSQPKRTSEQKADDLRIIIPLFLKGYSYMMLMQHINAMREYTLSHVTVYQDIRQVLAEWTKERGKLIEKHKIVELTKIDQLERTYWEAWEQSRAPKKKKVSKQGGQMVNHPITNERVLGNPDKVVMETHTTDSVGDSRWLDGIQWCISKRCELLGLNKPAAAGANADQDTNNTVRDIVFSVRGRKGGNEHIQEAEEIFDIDNPQSIEDGTDKD